MCENILPQTNEEHEGGGEHEPAVEDKNEEDAGKAIRYKERECIAIDI